METHVLCCAVLCRVVLCCAVLQCSNRLTMASDGATVGWLLRFNSEWRHTKHVSGVQRTCDQCNDNCNSSQTLPDVCLKQQALDVEQPVPVCVVQPITTLG